ncbi:MAG TPA: aminotransferase class V-fold PLP-dependent enzyme [Pirellulales bacterium]
MTEAGIYLDNHATTRVDPRVVEAMLPYFSTAYGNAASTGHAFGAEAKEAVDLSRERIAAAIGASPREIVFTSGATESNNLAIRGLADRRQRRGNHLVTVRTEHRAVIEPIERLGRRGFEVTILDVEQAGSPQAGWLDPSQVAQALRDDTLFVSVMLANNEIGVIQPIAEIARLCHERGVLVHCDATQAIGKLPVRVDELGIDLMSFSAHKLYGPKGVGALYVRRGAPSVRLEAQILGGGHEFGLRSGTLNVPGIVGFARALKLCLESLPDESRRLGLLRDRLYSAISGELEDVQLNGPVLDRPGLRLTHNLNVSFAYVDGEALLLNLKDIAVSSGSACTSANPEPSHVLRALGLSEEATRSSLRFGLGRFNTQAEIDIAGERVVQAVRRLRKLSSMA